MMKILLLIVAILFPAMILAEPAKPATDNPPAQPETQTAEKSTAEPAIEPKVQEILKKMSDYLKSLERFTVRVEKTTELILATDQRLHWDQTAEIALQKPDHLRADFQNLSDGRQLLYDGKTFTLYTPAINVYASRPAAPTIDETLGLLQEQYQISMPIADLLLTNPESNLLQDVESASYVGEILIRGTHCHHLAFRTPEIDWEIWIADGDKPLPRRLLLVDKSVEGSPYMKASLSDWDIAPKFSANFFSFTPPKNARKIKFLSELPVTPPKTKVVQ